MPLLAQDAISAIHWCMGGLRLWSPRRPRQECHTVVVFLTRRGVSSWDGLTMGRFDNGTG